MAVAVMIDGCQFTPVVIILLRKSKLIDLRTILERSRFNLKGSRIKILVNTSTIEPVLGKTSVQVQ